MDKMTLRPIPGLPFLSHHCNLGRLTFLGTFCAHWMQAFVIDKTRAQTMSRSQQIILSQLASSPNDVASGFAQCMEALRLISTLPRSSPIMVEYSGVKGSMIKAFGREHLSRVPFRVSGPFIFSTCDHCEVQKC